MKINADISLGNVLTIGTLVAGIAVGWGQVSSSLAAQDERITETAVRVDTIRDNLSDIKQSMAALSTDIKYMREALDRK